MLVETQQDNLRSLTRSLSIGDPYDKGKKILTTLSINLKYLYENPCDDLALNLQFQSIRGLANFLLNNHKIHSNLYRDFSEQKFPYIYSQPMLSSLFLIGILKQVRILSDKEMESLFLASYFKDIGMSLIPEETLNKKVLSPHEKRILRGHAETSVKILQGRVPLGPNYFRIIENHHRFSLLESENVISDASDEELIVSGFESVVVSLTDIIAAMISERPYRKSTTLFEALELTKTLIADSYSQEFKVIVSYFKQHFLAK